MKSASFLLASLILAFALPAQASTELSRAPVEHNFSPEDAVPSSAVQFARVIPDLPLMPGLETVAEDDVLFASPEGRIAETTAEGEVDIDNVYMFYRRTLPQLGWTPVNMKTYRREGDVLHIDAHAESKITTVEFSVTPAGK